MSESEPDPTVPDPPPVVRRRVWPADVTLPDGRQLAAVLVVVTVTEVWVWSAGPAGPRLQLRAAWMEDGSTLTREHLLEAAPMVVAVDGGQLVVRRARGCGCGSALQRFIPWSPWTVTS